MFTGLIESTGRLIERTATAGGLRVRIASELAAELREGDSLAVNGVCLTVVRAAHDAIGADIGPETIRATTLGGLEPGAVVNLERPLLVGGRMGGHFVQGHVDGVGQILARRPEAEFEWVTFGFPLNLAPYF